MATYRLTTKVGAIKFNYRFTTKAGAIRFNNKMRNAGLHTKIQDRDVIIYKYL